MKKILVAPTAFKGTMPASSVARAIELGIQLSGNKYKIDLLPLADGGDGTVESLAVSCGGTFHGCRVRNAFRDEHTASWLRLADIDVVELASLCGLAQLNATELQPLSASSHGLGDAIKDMITKGAKKIAVGLGGSASTDGGAGMLQALGTAFYGEDGRAIEITGGGNLNQITRMDLAPALELTKDINLTVLADVTNPLLGPEGAALTFAAQKGANPAECAQLEANLTYYAHIAETAAHKNLRFLPGAGAAGGCGFGLSLLNASITSGFKWIGKLLKINKRVAEADLVISGEGRVDLTSFSGKAIGHLAGICKTNEIPFWVIAGSFAEEIDYQNLGITKQLPLPCCKNFAQADDITRIIKHSLPNGF